MRMNARTVLLEQYSTTHCHHTLPPVHAHNEQQLRKKIIMKTDFFYFFTLFFFLRE